MSGACAGSDEPPTIPFGCIIERMTAHSVIITSPMPTLDEIGKELGLSRSEQKSLIRLVNGRGLSRSKSYAFKTARVTRSSARSAAGRRTKEESSGQTRKTENRGRR